MVDFKRKEWIAETAAERVKLLLAMRTDKSTDVKRKSVGEKWSKLGVCNNTGGGFRSANMRLSSANRKIIINDPRVASSVGGAINSSRQS